jgi:hypothetical protein
LASGGIAGSSRVGQAQQRCPQRHHRPLELDQLALELVDPLHLVLALPGEDAGLHLVDVLLELRDHVEVVLR